MQIHLQDVHKSYPMGDGELHAVRGVTLSIDRGEYVADGEARFGDAFFADDEVPETLVAVLQQIAIDFVPETLAAADFINDWLAQQTDLRAGTPIERGLGLAPFEVDGVTIRGLAQPHRFYLLRRAQQAFELTVAR